jgi:hypothetical protein
MDKLPGKSIKNDGTFHHADKNCALTMMEHEHYQICRQ